MGSKKKGPARKTQEERQSGVTGSVGYQQVSLFTEKVEQSNKKNKITCPRSQFVLPASIICFAAEQHSAVIVHVSLWGMNYAYYLLHPAECLCQPGAVEYRMLQSQMEVIT